MNTKTLILKAAGKLFAQKGFFGVSMKEIAQEVNISKAALYHHFESKDELAKVLLEDSIKELKSQLTQAVSQAKKPSDLLFNLIKTFLDFKISHPEISLLNTLASGTDNTLPIFTIIVTARQDLLKFIRDLVAGLDFTRQYTYEIISTMSTTIFKKSG
jgi:AcrR family transcriptional regulator